MRFFAVTITLGLILLASCSKEKKDLSTQNGSNQPVLPVQNIPNTTINLDSTKYLFEGTVGENLRVNAELSFNKTEITGMYRYYNGTRPLSLQGSLQNNNSLQLVERDNLGRGGWEKDSASTVTGTIQATLDKAQGIITGTWTSKDGKKTFPIVFQAIGKFILQKDNLLDVSVDYPQFALPVLAIMNDTLAQIGKKDFQLSYANVDTMRKEYLDEPEFKDRADMISEHYHSQVIFSSPTLVSVETMSDSYMGGAHGNYSYRATTWKIENNIPRRVTLTEIFKTDSDFRTQISSLLIKELRKQEASLVVEGGITSFVEDLTKENLTYAIHSSGLTFYFDPYQVASYAEGSFEIHLSWKSLQNLLRADFKTLLQNNQAKLQ